MQNFTVKPIGKIIQTDQGSFIDLDPQYIPALQGLKVFSHIQVLWWFSDFDDENFHNILVSEKPYKNSPKKMGTFATRGSFRPNPIALTASEVLSIDCEKGLIQIAFIDANDQNHILDIKPYTPSFDQVETPGVPD